MTKPTSSSVVHLPCSHEDILMKNILLTHALDDRHFDLCPLIRLAEEIMHWVTTKNETKLAANVEELWSDKHNELGFTIHHISIEISRDDVKSQSLHARTMGVLELLRNHSWGTKVAIVLAALAKCYGEFWLILQLCATNPLALSITRLKGLGNSLSIKESFGCGFKALKYLFKKMVDVAKCIAEFEVLPERYVTLDFEGMVRVKAHIHMACYWVIRSSTACASQITSMIVSSPKQMDTISVSANWELWSSSVRINNVQHCLREQLDYFYEITEKNIVADLYHMFEEAGDDNQRVLSSLFAMKNEFPFRDGSSGRKMEEGRTICLYGSSDIEWVRELANKIKGIVEAGYSLESMFIGSSNLEKSKENLATVITERLSRCLSLAKICMFWLRLESIRNSKSRLGFSIETDVITREATALHGLDMENKGWLLIGEGRGNDLLRLSGVKELECLSFFHIWGENMRKLGFLGSIRKHLDCSLTTNRCSFYSTIPYVEGMDESTTVCKNCKGPLKKRYLYECTRS